MGQACHCSIDIYWLFVRANCIRPPGIGVVPATPVDISKALRLQMSTASTDLEEVICLYVNHEVLPFDPIGVVSCVHTLYTINM